VPGQNVPEEAISYGCIHGAIRLRVGDDDIIHHRQCGHQLRPRPPGQERLRGIGYFDNENFPFFKGLAQLPDMFRQERVEMAGDPTELFPVQLSPYLFRTQDLRACVQSVSDYPENKSSKARLLCTVLKENSPPHLCRESIPPKEYGEPPAGTIGKMLLYRNNCIYLVRR